MTDPSIITIEDIPGVDVDPHWVKWARERAAVLEAGIPEMFADAAADHPKVVEWVRQIVREAVDRQDRSGGLVAATRGPWLLLLGPVSRGKTHQAYGALRALGASGVACSWMHVSAADFYAQLRPRHGVDSEEVFASFANATVLVFDDIGTGKTSEWVEEQNYRLINHRYERRMPTILTSNLSTTELRANLGDRVTDRIAQMSSRVVLEGPNRRKS
ncbi:ATP-binding protein [Saccharopolyspora sp. 6T]|uniref:ATP-binding protein n=1 Tax=Saccharopolyspora sp. 6T TaxID=2877238 RepID=UPI001CD1E744|nr:ATP-binding protein [Saccharopolyspora sp. 6T]MCA1185782.1 ATP-binding protein [Saccharopolyspora sp. 6T]